MASFDCRTPGCTGRITFEQAGGGTGGGDGAGPLDQLTGQPLEPAHDHPVECPVCHVFWRAAQFGAPACDVPAPGAQAAGPAAPRR